MMKIHSLTSFVVAHLSIILFHKTRVKGFIIYSIVWSFLSYKGFCQDVPRIFPPSPEASALASFGEVPISLYSGTIDLQVPIHSLKVKSYELPVYLSYDSRRNKVETLPSRVGLGWTLNAGGMVSRTVRGHADEYGSNGFVTFRMTGGGYEYHTGLVMEVSTDDDGNTVISFGHNSSGIGALPDSFTLSSGEGWDANSPSFYKWDTKPDYQKQPPAQISHKNSKWGRVPSFTLFGIQFTKRAIVPKNN